MRGNPQISQDSINLLHSIQPQVPLDIPEIGLYECESRIFRSICKRIAILIKSIEMAFIQVF